MLYLTRTQAETGTSCHEQNMIQMLVKFAVDAFLSVADVRIGALQNRLFSHISILEEGHACRV